MVLPMPKPASTAVGPASSSLSASREVAGVAGRIRCVGTTLLARANQVWMVIVLVLGPLSEGCVDGCEDGGGGGGRGGR